MEKGSLMHHLDVFTWIGCCGMLVGCIHFLTNQPIISACMKPGMSYKLPMACHVINLSKRKID